MSGITSQTGQTLTFQGRHLRGDGIVIPFEYDLAVPSTRVLTSLVEPLEEGFLLSLSVGTLGGSVGKGKLFARAEMTRNLQPSAFVVQRLIADYVTGAHAPGWPGARLLDSTDGQGFIRTVVATTPAAGTEISLTVPTGARWRLKGFAFTLTTAIAVANRAVTVIVDDGANGISTFQAQALQTASLARIYYGDSSGGTVDLTAADIPIFTSVDIPMAAGWRVRTSTANLQAADAYTFPNFYVEEWLEP